MLLRMKTFNILGVHWKIRLFFGGEGGGVTKNQYIGQDCLKRRAWPVCWFKVGLTRKRGVLFLRGVLILQCPLCPPSFYRHPYMDYPQFFLKILTPSRSLIYQNSQLSISKREFTVCRYVRLTVLFKAYKILV